MCMRVLLCECESISENRIDVRRCECKGFVRILRPICFVFLVNASGL